MTSTEAKPLSDRTVPQRLHHAIGPIAGGMILDAADLITFGPLGIYAGAIVGVVVGFWITSIYGLSLAWRIFWAAAAALYCTVPMTELFPVATGISAVAPYVED